MDETTIISAEQPTKFEDDYELNKKDPNAIVYTAAFTLDVHAHVTAQMKTESASRMQSFISSIV